MHPAPNRRRSLAARLNDHRALLMLALLYAALLFCAPNFASAENTLSIFKAASLNAIVAIGFTLILILGQLDLSIGAVVMLAGMLAVGLQPQLGWGGSIPVAILAGILVGLVNGLLVVKLKINSFIATLGTMSIVTGLMQIYSGGGSRVVADLAFADWLKQSAGLFPPPIVIITLVLVLAAEFLLRRTPVGRGMLLVGANPETAWVNGLNRDRYLIGGFIFCATMAAAGGALFGAGLSAMSSSTLQGTFTLMTVISGVIIGGTLMTGGRGSVLNSFFAVLMLATLFNGINSFGFGFEVQIFINGLIMAAVVLYEAYANARHERLKGRRPDLMLAAQSDPELRTIHPARRLAPLLLVSLIAAAALIALFLASRHQAAPASASPAQQLDPGIEAAFALRGSDGQPLVLPPGSHSRIPPRPADPAALPETDRGHWWDIEFAGRRILKEPMPLSPGDGPLGKRVILLKAGDHPYWSAYVRGFEAIAQLYGMQVKIMNGNWNMDLQSQQAAQAINERPDMIILCPVDATACTQLLRNIHQAGIPCIASNTIPTNEAMRYCLAWTGPDDWGQFRMLTRDFADALGKQGGFSIVRHMPGSSPFFARTFAPVTELAEYAPDMKLLAMDTSNLETEASMQLVSGWITRFGPELKGLILCDDGFVLTGAIEALNNAGRRDVVIVAAGNSKIGMDAVHAGRVRTITHQSAEADGALALHTAARWFYGEPLDPVIYLPRHLITQADAQSFMPAQW